MRSQIAKWRTTGTWGPILALKWRTRLEKSRRVALDSERSPYFATASMLGRGRRTPTRFCLILPRFVQPPRRSRPRYRAHMQRRG
jgi:hypothetical protein